MIRFSIDDSSVVDWRVSIDSSARLLSVPGVISDLKIVKNSCNELNELNLSRFDNLRSFEVESNALKSVKNLTMNGLNELRSIEIESGSLT